MIGVNRAPVRTRHSGQARNSGHDTFEKKKTGVTFSGIRVSRIRFGPADRVEPKRGATPLETNLGLGSLLVKLQTSSNSKSSKECDALNSC